MIYYNAWIKLAMLSECRWQNNSCIEAEGGRWYSWFNITGSKKACSLAFCTCLLSSSSSMFWSSASDGSDLT